MIYIVQLCTESIRAHLIASKNQNIRPFNVGSQRVGGSTGLLIMVGGDSCPSGHEFESQCRILDGSFFTLFVVKTVLMFEKTEHKLKQRP